MSETTLEVRPDAVRRVEEAFGHEPHCHTHGCPGQAYCADAGRMGFFEGVERPRCDVTVCTCITAAIQKVVRDERALALEQAGEAIFGFSTKPQRGLRMLRRFAQQVRDGQV